MSLELLLAFTGHVSQRTPLNPGVEVQQAAQQNGGSYLLLMYDEG